MGALRGEQEVLQIAHDVPAAAVPEVEELVAPGDVVARAQTLVQNRTVLIEVRHLQPGP